MNTTVSPSLYNQEQQPHPKLAINNKFVHTRNNQIRTFFAFVKISRDSAKYFGIFCLRIVNRIDANSFGSDVKLRNGWNCLLNSLLSSSIYVRIFSYRPKRLDGGQTVIHRQHHKVSAYRAIHAIGNEHTQNDVSASSWRDVALHKWIVNYEVNGRRPQL